MKSRRSKSNCVMPIQGTEDNMESFINESNLTVVKLSDDSNCKLILNEVRVVNTDTDDKQYNHQSHCNVQLSVIQERQKLLEEQNKKRRDFLLKTISDRKQHAQCEASKLQLVQAELLKLDQLLSSDVGILRNEIEVASFEFNEAQKRYDRAENEFIEAKLLFFQKKERKEMLTEHLYRVIDANEQRKAQRLSEMMTKLEVVDVIDSGSKEEVSNIVFEGFELPVSLDEITHTASSTLKNPKKFCIGKREKRKKGFLEGCKINNDSSLQPEDEQIESSFQNVR